MRNRSCWLGAIFVLSLTAPLAAQRPVATLRGVVTDSTTPLDGATVEIFGIKRKLQTGADGLFRFDSLKPGPYWISIRRIGFVPFTFTATLLGGQDRSLEVVLEPAPYRLSDLEVKGGMIANRYFDFEWRRRTAWGRFFTRDDIARLRPLDVVDLAQRGLPGWSRFDLEQVYWGEPVGSSSGFGYAGARRGYQRCTPAISINGSIPWPGSSLRDYRIEDLEALEVYWDRRVPLEFQGMRGTGCGVVVVWLK